ncbi:MAG: hypothetical protein ABSG48_00515 [Geobacteraceae bacterium]|jgi:alpha-tubulin suppressor-like RCC1 family protein
MKKIPGHYSHLALWVLLMVLLAACGNKNSTLTSSSNPGNGYYHSVAFRNYTTFTWGANSYGQLGNGDNTGVSQLSPIHVLPIQVSLTRVAGISAGGTHTLAFTSGGNVWSWGNNGFGQLGNNSTTASSTPVQISSLGTTTTAVSAGWAYSLALQSDGTVWAWGDNEFGQLGNTTGPVPVTPSLIPVQVLNPLGSNLTLVTKIAAGGGHSLALAGLEGNKPVYAWGYNSNGQLGQQSNPRFGNLSTSSNSNSAVEVTKADGTILSNVTDIAAGGSHSLFIVNDGVNPATVWACGSNFYGQLGVGVSGDTKDRNRGVVQVVALTGIFSQVAAGSAHSLALRQSDGTVWAWGYNVFGQLGNGAALGSSSPVNTPFQVKMSNGSFLTGVTKIVAIGNHSLAVDINGQLWAWGENTFGELGLGDTTNRNLATQVPRFSSRADLYHP